MTKWALVLTIFYSLLSNPSGEWKYTQIFWDLESEAVCEDRAEEEHQAANKFGGKIKSLPFELRSMYVKRTDYWCGTEEELNRMIMAKERSND